MLGHLKLWLRESRGIALSTAFQLGLALFALAAMPFDQRRILGLNPWVKPLKFDLSTTIFLVTVAAILYGLEGVRRSKVWIGWGIGLSMAVEDAIISLQSLRGVPSHMNFSSGGNSIAFGIMGLFIVINTVLVGWALALYLQQRTRWRLAVAWGFRLGLLALLAGSLEGVVMVVHRKHTVGAADGLAGLPFIDWSRDHGDLRIPHFFALHALQGMPALGWLLSRLCLPERLQLILLCAGFLAYMGAVAALFEQAMGGRPLL